MITDALLAYLHFASILILAGALSAQALLLRATPGTATVMTLVRCDVLYLIAALLVLASGAARLFFGAKGYAVHLANPWFHAKLGLFIAIGLLSIGPTRQFLRWRRASLADPAFMPAEDARVTVRRRVMLEIHLLALVPLAAAFIARGIVVP